MTSEAELDEYLSRPTAADVTAARELDGDILILGVSGKMGPSLARLARRASEDGGVRRRVIGAARFSQGGAQRDLERDGIETVPCDLLDRREVERLPDCSNVIFMVGQKFGTTDNPSLSWAVNTVAPALAAERFRDSRIVAFSTGNVYPLVSTKGAGSSEQDLPAPVGEYAQSALARERVFEHYSQRHGTPMAILRLNYAVEPRYGVIRDLADAVLTRRPIPLAMGYVNVIWQRDANSVALRALLHCASPPLVLNVTGPEKLGIRDLAKRLGGLLGVEPILEGHEAETALLSNASRCHELLGPPEMSADRAIEMVAEWVKQGGRRLGKPTHYEERSGAF